MSCHDGDDDDDDCDNDDGDDDIDDCDGNDDDDDIRYMCLTLQPLTTRVLTTMLLS